MKAYTIAPMYRYGAARPRPLPRALAALARGDRLGGPGDRRRGDPVLRGAAAAARRDRVGAAAQLDRRRELPPAVRRAARASGSTRIPSLRRRGGRAQARDERPPGLRREERAGARRARRRAEDRRLALRRLPRALRRGQGASRRATASRTCSTRRSCAASTTTRARPSSSSGRRRTSTRRSAAAAATTASSRRSAVRRRPASASAPASSGSCSRWSARARPPEAPRLDLFVAFEEPELRGRSSRRSPSWRAEGRSVDTDYAGRSMKGQLTQAQRLGAETVVVARSRRDVRGAAARGGGPRRARPRGALGGLARRHVRRAAGRRRRPPRHGRRLGRHAPRPRRARLRRPPRPHREGPARPQPGALARRGRDRARDPQRVRRSRRPARSWRARRSASTRTSPTGQIEIQVDELRILSRSTPLPFQLDEENVDETLRLRYRWLDMRTERMQRNLRLNHTAISAIRRVDGRARLRRRLDAEHDARHARGRARLPHSGAPAAREVLRARPVAAAVQAALHGRRDRPLLPDRDVLARRGSPRRPAVRVPAARPRDGVRRAARTCST